VGSVHDQNVVKRLPSDRADDALAVRVHPRRTGRAEQRIDAIGLEDRVEGVSVPAVAVPQHEARRLDALPRSAVKLPAC
jgi:hypothetical protein